MMSILTRLKISTGDLKKPSVLILIITNLVPIYGVLFWSWQVFPIMFLYWFENIVIGVSNVFKMAFVAPNNAPQRVAKIAMIPFFCVHYGLFTLVHGVFVLVIFGGSITRNDPTNLTVVFRNLADLKIGWAMLGLGISHAVSFFINYIKQGEYTKSSLPQLMGQPYVRVVILHVTIIFSGFLVTLFDSPVSGLILLIALKTLIDVKTHLKQHNLLSNVKSNVVETVIS